MISMKGQNVTAAGFTSYPNKKYYDEYSYGTTFHDATAFKRAKLGDTTKEIIKELIYYGGWYGDRVSFVTISGWSCYVFYRGHALGYRGIFSFSSDTGAANATVTGRSALVIY